MITNLPVRLDAAKPRNGAIRCPESRSGREWRLNALGSQVRFDLIDELPRRVRTLRGKLVT